MKKVYVVMCQDRYSEYSEEVVSFTNKADAEQIASFLNDKETDKMEISMEPDREYWVETDTVYESLEEWLRSETNVVKALQLYNWGNGDGKNT